MLKNYQVSAGPPDFHGFLIGIELEEGVPLQLIIDKLSEAAMHVEGVGRTDVEYLGKISSYEADASGEKGSA